jgi:putative FmdB family regulatory protein
MPIYEYRCQNGHTLEVLQRMSDRPLSACTACEAPVQRVFHPVAIHFKGSGFYSTDYGKRNAKGADDPSKSDSASSSEGSKSDSGSGGSDSASKAGKSESKAAKTSGGKSSD